jgi:hypothetical protein
MNKIYTVTRKARLITDQELEELEKIAKGQIAFFSPLRMATTARQKELGEYNFRVLACVRNLRDTIVSGEHLVKKPKP